MEGKVQVRPHFARSHTDRSNIEATLYLLPLSLSLSSFPHFSLPPFLSFRTHVEYAYLPTALPADVKTRVYTLVLKLENNRETGGPRRARNG